MEGENTAFPNLPKTLLGLSELAGNLWWSWHPEARMLFKMLDRQAWKDSGHNPVKMLKDIPKEIVQGSATDAGYLQQYDDVLARFRKEREEKSCLLTEASCDQNTYAVAYFCAEYGLHHSIPFYAGGLGFLASDFIKECSDLKVPLVAVGFMYSEGYFRQRIREDGWQEGIDEMLDLDSASITRVMGNDGKQVVVKVPLVDPPIYVAVWQITVGHVPLYLMDTAIEINSPWNRGISAHLYTGDIEQRLRQEVVLGLGGQEVLRTLGIKYFLLHLNEGHPAFALLERIREKVDQGVSYEEAIQQVQTTSVFTTHTPVPAGHDVFPFHLMEKYFSSYWPALTLDHDSFLQLGIHPEEPHAGFNMTAFAMKMSNYRNAVSNRHGVVARRMWQSLWPELKEESIPIDHVTNGVHIPTWIEPKLALLFNKYLGSHWLDEHDNPALWNLVDTIPDEELWKTHYWLKIKLIDAIRERTRQRWVNDRTSPTLVVTGGTLLDPSLLTIGFARRFATYKRADLVFYDSDRLKKLLNDRWRPIQFIFAGKAHPADDPGKRILQRIFKIACDQQMGGRIAFVEDYGEQFAQYMVHGVDVWLNNPLPPLEASGTSGMKAAINGVLNLSITDGWWAEGFNGKNGWAFGQEGTQDRSDQADAAELYEILEQEIIPLYYTMLTEGIPYGWVKMMKESIKSVGSRFSARRMVREYMEKFYMPSLNKQKL
jgi:starch phosphorylase